MTPPPDTMLRASDADREQHAELLRRHSAQGRLTVDELEERLDRVYAARTVGELAPVVSDLPAPEPPRTPRPRTRRRPEVVAFLAVNLVLIAIWAATGAGYFWPIWPLLGWGLGLMGPCGRALPRGWGLRAPYAPALPRRRPRAR